MNNQWFSFDPNESFLKLNILWVVVGLITFVALVLATIIFYYSNLEPRADYLGFNQFVTYFKVPLGLWALSIPIVALLAANHRSEQTKEQIKIITSQNIFSNHYKHVEEFEKYCKNIEKPLIIKNHRKTHSKVFPRTLDGNYKLQDESLVGLKKIYDLIIDELKLFDSSNNWKMMARVEHYMIQTEELFGCKYMFSDISFECDGVQIINDLETYLNFVKERINALNRIFQFDHSYEEDDLFLILLKLDGVVKEISSSTQKM